MTMKLFKYNQFLDLKPLNENVQKAKSYLKEFYLTGLAARELGFISEDMEYELKEGGRRVFLMKDFTPEQQQQIRNKIKGRGEFEGKGIRLSDEDVRKIESNPEFKLVRELKVEVKDSDGKVKGTYQLDRNNPNWVSNFTYFYFAENMSIEQLTDIYSKLIDYKDYLDKLPKKFDMAFIDESIPNENHPHSNGEDLSDELDKLKSYRQIGKIKETLPTHLKKAFDEASELQREELSVIAQGFLEFKPEEKRADVWKSFFGEMQEDRQPTLPDGKPNPNFGKMRYMSRLGLIKTLNDFIKSAKGHLQGSSSSGYTAFMEKVNKCNDKFGVKGATVVFNESGILVLKIHSYAANNFLNSYTGHCIADRGEGYWNSYIGETNVQYYVYNFNLSSSTDLLSTIGVTIRPDRTYQSGACQNARNIYIGDRFKQILKNWEKEYDISVDIYQDVLKPMSKEEIERIQKAKIAEREIVKKGLSIEQINKYVKEDGADINKDNAIALVHAVEENNLEKVQAILALGANPNLRSGDHAAIAKAKNLEMIKLLVSNGAELNSSVFDNIVSDISAVEYCLKAGLDPNFGNFYPLRMCAKGSYKNREDSGEAYFEIIKLLVKYGAKVSEPPRNVVLRWLSEFGRDNVLEYFKELGIDKGYTKADFQGALAWNLHSRKLNEQDKKRIEDYLKKRIEELE
jgi:hypothetical protein